MTKKKRPQKKPQAGKEFTLVEIRAAAVARFQEIHGDGAEQVAPRHHAAQAIKALDQFIQSLQVEEPTDALVIERKLVTAYLRLDLAAQAAGVNMNRAIPMIFNEEGAEIKSAIELEYLDEDADD